MTLMAQAVFRTEPVMALATMPDDFAPGFLIDEHPERGRAVVCRTEGELPDGKATPIALGFVLTDDAETNGALMHALRQAVWQALELARLGQAEELKSLLGGN